MNETLQMGTFSLRLHTRQVTWPGSAVVLSRQECALLQVLIQHDGPIQRDALIGQIWGEEAKGTSGRLSASLRRLKLKLNEAPVIIEFQPAGYVIRSQDEQHQGIPLTDRHIDPEKSCIYVGGERIPLTPPENKLLAQLLQTPNQFISRDALMEHIWGASSTTKGPAFSALLHRVRKKVEPDASAPIHLVADNRGRLCLQREVAPEAPTEDEAPTVIEAPFVGRTAQTLAYIDALRDGVRCLTVLGPGGQGKTRLVRQLIQREEILALFPGGANFCDVADCHTAEAVVLRVASVLGVQLKSRGDGADLSARLGQALALRPRSLVVLDNFEQIVSAASDTLGTWVRLTHQIQFVVTSRRRLGLNAEQVMPLDALPLTDAMTLFLGRVRQLNPSLRLGTAERKRIAPILEAMERNALAVLLSAGQLQDVSFEDWAQGVEQDSYGGGLLETVIERSWRLLSPSEQNVLLQSTVFRGGFNIEAAEEVLQCDEDWIEDVLERLLDHSLLFVREDASGSRFYLYESVRAFCVPRVQSGGFAPAFNARYVAYFERFASMLHGTLRGGTEPSIFDRAHTQLLVDEDNFWQVFDQTHTQPNSTTGIIALLLMYTDRHHRRAEDICECLNVAAAKSTHPLRAELQYSRWSIATNHIDTTLADAIRHAALEDPQLPSLFRMRFENSETREAMYAQRPSPALAERVEAQLKEWPEPSAERIYLLETLALMRTRMGRQTEAIALYQEAIRDGKGYVNPGYLRILEGNIGHKLVDIGRLDEAIELLNNSLHRMRQPYGRRLNIPVSCWSLGAAWLANGEIETALEVFEEGFQMACTLGQTAMARGLNASVALIYWLLGDLDSARGIFERHPPSENPKNRLVGFPSLAHAFFTLWTGERERAEADWQAISELYQDEWHHFWRQCVALTKAPNDPSAHAKALETCTSHGIRIARTPVGDEDINAYAAPIMWIFPMVLEHRFGSNDS